MGRSSDDWKVGKRPIRTQLCFLFSTNKKARLGSRIRPQPISRRLLTKHLRALGPAGAVTTPTATPTLLAPPLGAGPVPDSLGWRWGRAPAGLDSCVLRPPRRCWAPGVLIVLCRDPSSEIPSSGPGAAAASARTPPGGLRSPRAGKWGAGVATLLWAPGLGCGSRRRASGPKGAASPGTSRAPPPGSPRRLRHLAGRWRRGPGNCGRDSPHPKGGTLQDSPERSGPPVGWRTCRWKKNCPVESELSPRND